MDVFDLEERRARVSAERLRQGLTPFVEDEAIIDEIIAIITAPAG